MLWMAVTLTGYFFNAVTALIDKYLLAGHIKAPAVYAFFVSLFSLFALLFIPFGFRFFGWQITGLFLLSGMLFLYGLLVFYFSVQRWEISRASPLLGTVVSVTALSAVFLPGAFAEESFTLMHILALLLLISGGFLISFDLPLKRGENVSVAVIAAGITIGVSLLLLKYGYARTNSNFISGFVWSRIGMFAAGLSLFAVPAFRAQILEALNQFSMASKPLRRTGLIIMTNKICGGIASFLITYATFLGPISFVQALSGTQYVFLLALVLPLSWRYPQVFGERLFFWDWFQRASAIALISLGLWIFATSGIKLLLI